MSYVMGGIAVGTSIYQIVKGAQDQKKAQAEKAKLEANTPKYAGSSALEALYQESKAESHTPAEQTAQFKMGQNIAQRNMATGLSGSNIGQGGQGLVSKLVQGGNDMSMRNLTQGQQLKEQRMNRFGAITGQKAAEDFNKFKINQQQPFEMKYSDIIAKGTAAAQTKQAGFQNAFNALGNAASAANSRYIAKNYGAGYTPPGNGAKYTPPGMKNKSKYFYTPPNKNALPAPEGEYDYEYPAEEQ